MFFRSEIEEFPSDDSSTSDGSSSEEEEPPEEEWSEKSKQSKQHNFPFKVESSISTGSATTPFDYFKLLFNNTFVNLLVSCINTNAMQILVEKSMKKANEFNPTTVDEVYTLLGVYFLMGYIKVSNLSYYWSSHPLFNLKFEDYMGRERFCLLLRALAYRRPLRDDDNGDTRRSWYDAAKPIANMFNCVMKSLVTPGKQLNIDKFTAHWFNELNFVRRKPERIRMHLLSDTHGIFHRVYLCHPDGKHKGDEVVKTLMKDFVDAGRSLYSCPCYTSVSLAEELLERKTYLTGILKRSKHRNPSITKKKVKVGFVKSLYNAEGVCVSNIRKPHKTIISLTTEHNPLVVNKVTADIEPITKFKHHTNMFKRNQTLADNAPSDTTKRFNRHVLYLLQAMFMNSFIMYNMKQSQEKVTYSDYRRSIFYDLLPVPNIVDSESSEEDDVSLNDREERQDEVIHLPADWPPGKKIKYCRHCVNERGLKKRTEYYCPQCPQKWGFCIECFRAFHNY